MNNKENENIKSNNSNKEYQELANLNENAFSPHSVAVSFLEDQSIPNQTNRKIVANRTTDLNNSAANLSANKISVVNGASAMLNNTSTEPFRSVDVLGQKRRQINLSKTHCQL